MGQLSLRLTLVVSTITLQFLQASATSFDLDSFRLVNPYVSAALHDSRIFNVTAEIESYNQSLYFILERNDDLIPQDISIQYWNSHGDAREGNHSVHQTVQYARGSVRMGRTPEESTKVGWARLELSQNLSNPVFSGKFTIKQDQYAVELKVVNGSTFMVSTKHEPQHGLDNRCTTSPKHHSHKRQTLNPWNGNDLISNIGSTNGCPNTRRIAYIGIMTDCSFTSGFDSPDSAHRYIVNMVNTASVVFESSFNVSLGIQNLTISDAECPSGSSGSIAWNVPCSQGDLNSRLDTFSQWRSSIYDSNAYWTLLTGCSVATGEIGVSWVGALCNSGSGRGNGASANVVARTQTEWQVFAHESGHMFGAVHDCNSDTCPSQSSGCCPLSSSTCDAGSQYIMNPIAEPSMTRFSPCTIGTVCSRLGTGLVNGRCLVDAQTGNNTQQCGNGVVESGEACDCGNGACNEQETQCCDPLTCQYTQGDGCNGSNTGGNENDGGTNDGGTNNGYPPSQGGYYPSSWMQRHRPLVVGLAAGIGGALLLLFFACLVGSCRRVRRPRAAIFQ